jgi:PAS domain S-box-containing protein
MAGRNESERAQQESEQRLQLLITHAPAALAMFDRDMCYLAVSRRWLSDYGLQDRNIIGRSHYEIFPEIPDHWKEVHRRALLGEVVRADEDHFQRADGSAQWLRWEVRPWHTVDGQIGGIVIFTEDITERKQAELALRESEERLRLALDAAHMGTFDWEVANNRITWSRWHEELWGFQPGEFGGTYEAFSERVHPEDLPNVNAKVARCIAARESFEHEFRVVWPDGSVHWVLGRGMFTFAADGRPLRMRGVVMETTDRKRSEQMIKESYTRLRTILDSMFAFVGLLSPEGVILEVNRAPLDIAGLVREDVIGKACADGYWVSYSPTVQAEVREALAKAALGEVVRYDAQIRVGDERLITIDLMFMPLRDTQGNVVQIVGSAVDITSRKQAELALRESRKRLAILSRQLIAAQETERRNLARELHDEIGQILTAVHISLQQVRHSCPPTAWGRLDEADRIVDRAIQEVRSMSLNLRPAMLDDFGLEAAVRWYVERQQRPDCPIHLDIQSCGVPLTAELSNTGYRIIQEALTNVQRHAQAKNAWVQIVHTPAEIRLLVRDDGVGCDVAAVNERAIAGRSFGVLGMQERVELLGGQFAFESSPGKGTTVRVRLPVPGSDES